MKRIICLVLCTALLTLCSCAESEKQPSPLETTSKTTTSTTTTTVATTTQAPELSDECDEILAEGEDENGNYYELVANETEDYQGLHIEMGVIKNNTWLMPLSEDFPFITPLLTNKGIYYENIEFSYIGNGCFYVDEPQGILINANTQKVYEGNCYVDFGDSDPNDRDNLIITGSDYDMNTKTNWAIFLNTETMKTQNVMLPWNNDVFNGRLRWFFPYVNGTFACLSYFNSEEQGFYNLKGKKVIDLSEYNMESHYDEFDYHRNYPLVFVDGECEMLITNDVGTDYIVTIDKKGNVVDSEEADY